MAGCGFSVFSASGHHNSAPPAPTFTVPNNCRRQRRSATMNMQTLVSVFKLLEELFTVKSDGPREVSPPSGGEVAGGRQPVLQESSSCCAYLHVLRANKVCTKAACSLLSETLNLMEPLSPPHFDVPNGAEDRHTCTYSRVERASNTSGHQPAMNHCVPDWSFLHDLPRNNHSKSPRPVDELVELLWQDGHVVMNSQTQREVMATPSLTRQCTEPEQVSKGSELFKNSENVVQEEAAPWAQCSVDDSFEKEFCQGFFYEPLRTASTSTHKMLAAEGDKIVKHMAPARNGISEGHSSVAEQPTIPLFGKKPMPAQSGFASPLLHITNRNTKDLRNFTHFTKLPEIEKLPLNRALGKSSIGFHVEPGESSSKMTKESSICASNQVHSLFYPSPSTTTKAASAEGMEDDAPAVIADDKETCDINETVNTSSSGASVGRTGQQNRQIIMHKRKGRDGDEPECQSEEADGASVEKNMQFQRSSSARRRRAAEVHNLSERKRRDRINRKMRDLQELIPHCNKADKASMLDEAIEYLKSLQLQVQIMWMRSGMIPMMFPGVHPFMPQMGMGMENTSLPSVQSPHLTHVPLVNQSGASNTDVNHVLLSPSDINQVNFRTQMQNVLIPGSFTHYPGFQHMQLCPRMMNINTSGLQLMQQNQAAFANSNLTPRVGDTSPVKAQYNSSGKSA